MAAMETELWIRHYPPRHVLTCNTRPDEQRVVKLAEPATFITTLPLETDAVSLRIGLMNSTDLPFPIEGVCVAESSNWPDAQAAAWSYFSFQELGEAALTNAPQRVMVPRSVRHPVTNARDVPIIKWSDWLPFRTGSGGRPQLIFRTFIATSVAILSCPGDNKPLFPEQKPRHRAQLKISGDHVTAPAQPLGPAEPTPYSPIAIVQYRTEVPGTQIVIGGDSHLARRGVFAQLLADQLSQPDAPVSVWNTAREARSSNTFWPALDQAIDLAQPSITIIQGWTANDGMTAEKDQAYLARVKESAERTLAAGGIPVIIKGLPRHLADKAALASWQSVNRQLETLVPDALVFDPLPYVERTDAPGYWQGQFTEDGIHQNLRGNLALREPFKRLLMDHAALLSRKIA